MQHPQPKLDPAEGLTCGCCKGPENDRCVCWNHQDVPHGRPVHICSRHRPTEEFVRDILAPGPITWPRA